MQDITAKKIAVLMSDRAPLWQTRKLTSFTKKCKLLDIETTPIYRWLRDGAPVRERTNNLENFCQSYNQLCKEDGLTTALTKVDILRKADVEVEMERFAGVLGIARIELDQALVQFRMNHGLDLPLPSILQDIGDKQCTDRYEGGGIYFLHRYDERGNFLMTGLVIIGDWLYYKISERHRKRLIFTKLLNPHNMQPVTNKQGRSFDYYDNEGFVIPIGRYKHFIFQLSNYDGQEIIMFTAELNTFNLQDTNARFKGKYLSTNLESNDSIDTRNVEMEWLTSDVTDANITKYLDECQPPQQSSSPVSLPVTPSRQGNAQYTLYARDGWIEKRNQLLRSCTSSDTYLSISFIKGDAKQQQTDYWSLNGSRAARDAERYFKTIGRRVIVLQTGLDNKTRLGDSPETVQTWIREQKAQGVDVFITEENSLKGVLDSAVLVNNFALKNFKKLAIEQYSKDFYEEIGQAVTGASQTILDIGIYGDLAVGYQVTDHTGKPVAFLLSEKPEDIQSAKDYFNIVCEQAERSSRYADGILPVTNSSVINEPDLSGKWDSFYYPDEGVEQIGTFDLLQYGEKIEGLGFSDKSRDGRKDDREWELSGGFNGSRLWFYYQDYKTMKGYTSGVGFLQISTNGKELSGEILYPDSGTRQTTAKPFILKRPKT